MKTSNKFDKLTKEDLLKACLEMEDELERLRPKPAKYKLGQVLAHVKGWPFPPGSFHRGQPGHLFVVLSVECRGGLWYYGYAKRPGSSGPGSFSTYPESQVRALTPTEIDGQSPAQSSAQSDEALPMTGQASEVAGQALVQAAGQAPVTGLDLDSNWSPAMSSAYEEQF